MYLHAAVCILLCSIDAVAEACAFFSDATVVLFIIAVLIYFKLVALPYMFLLLQEICTLTRVLAFLRSKGKLFDWIEKLKMKNFNSQPHQSSVELCFEVKCLKVGVFVTIPKCIWKRNFKRRERTTTTREQQRDASNLNILYYT